MNYTIYIIHQIIKSIKYFIIIIKVIVFFSRIRVYYAFISQEV
jgi:hypothetical protein